MKPKFKFNEIVEVILNNEPAMCSNKKLGYIIGMAQNEVNGEWGYAVMLYDFKECWDFNEYDLITTGKFHKNHDSSNSSLKVIVN